MKCLEHENMKLKLKVLDCQIKERDYVHRINVLEKNKLILEKKSEKVKRKKKEKEFIKVMKETFGKWFGIEDLNEMWRK